MDKKTSFFTCFLFVSVITLLLGSHVSLAQDDANETNATSNEVVWDTAPEQDKIFDSWVVEGESFAVSGLEVFVAAGKTGGEGIFMFPQKTIVLTVPYCLMVDRLKVCMHEWAYVIGGAVKIHGDDKQKYLITVSVPSPALTVTRAAGETNLEVGQSTRVTVTLKNEGTEPALGIKYAEIVPPQFAVSIPNNLVQRGNSLTWEGSMPAGDEKNFAYNIMAKSEFEGDISAVIEYKSHSVPKKIEDALKVVVEPLIGINQARDKSELTYGDEDRVYLTIENKRAEDMDVELIFTVPKPLYVVATSFNDTVGDSLMWKGTVGGGEEMKLITRIRADEPGLHRINVSARASFTDGKTADAQEYVDINVSIDKAELYFIPKKIGKGMESKIRVYLKNPNTYAEFTDIDISAESGYFNGTAHLDKYKPSAYNDVLSFDVKPDEAGNFDAKARVAYSVKTKRFTVEKNEKIEITEEKAVEKEPEPVQENKTEVKNETAPPSNETEEKKVGFGWMKKELYAVSFGRKVIEDISGIFSKIFNLRDAIGEVVTKNQAKTGEE